MLLRPQCIGKQSLSDDVLAEDKKHCQKIGPCGIGKQAVYLNSFFIERRYYVVWGDVRRLFKRVALSKGGFSGKGMFGSMPYLVAELTDGRQIQCNFKYEEQVDQFLAMIRANFPVIHTYSSEAEKRLEEERRKEEAAYLKSFTPEAEDALGEIEKASAYLQKKPELYAQLERSAREKRIWSGIHPGYKAFAVILGAMCAASIAFGIWAMFAHQGGAMYFVLFGFAFLLLIMTTRVMPTASHNSKTIGAEYEMAAANMQQYLSSYDEEQSFPLPHFLAHPAVLKRMERRIRKGEAFSIPEALSEVEEEIRHMNAGVTVSQTEHDEIVSAMPLFRVR